MTFGMLDPLMAALRCGLKPTPQQGFQRSSFCREVKRAKRAYVSMFLGHCSHGFGSSS